MTAREELTYKSGKPKEFIDTVQVVPLSDALAILDRQKAKLRELVECMENEKKEMTRGGVVLDDWRCSCEYWQHKLEAVLKEE